MRTALGLLAILMTSSLMAEEIDNEYGIVGLSTTYGNSAFSTKDTGIVGITPNLFYYSDIGFIDGSLFNYSAFRHLGLSANWRFAEVSERVNEIPNGIENRKGNPELGVTFGTPGVRLTYLHDVAGVHKGQEVQLHLGRILKTPIEGFSISPYGEVDWRDKKLSQHIYSVSTEEANASGLKRFDSNSSWLYKAGLIGLYDVTKNWVIISKVQAEHHSSHSELVQRDIGWSTEIGLVYKFAGN